MKKLVSLFLAAVLLCGCATKLNAVASSYVGGNPVEEAQAAPFHTELSFSALSDAAPNAALTIEKVKELLFRIERGELSPVDAKKLTEQYEDAYRELETAAALAYVRYCFDVTDAARKEAYDALCVQTETLYALLVQINLLLAENPALSDEYDAQTKAALQHEKSLHDPSLEALHIEERALTGAYEAAAQGFTIEAQGRTWTREQILNDPTLSYDSFKPLYEAYLNAYNRCVGEIYLKLIDVRNRIAKACGYPSYAEYAYALYARDYTPDDTARLGECIRLAVVPLFTALQEQVFDAQIRLSCGTFRQEATMARVAETLTAILPELNEPWTYMLSHGMIDCTSSERRMQGSFTTYFASYGAPFLYSSWDGSYTMPTTLLHEFGHYASYYRNGEAAADSLDLCETDSQGLELLAFSEYDRLYGALADAAKTANLFYALYVLLSGSMEDAFQQYAYHTEGVTLEQLNAEYGRLAEAYGLMDLGLDALSWTEIPHTFRSPLYYISYSMGMIPALELYLRAKTDRDAATTAYRTILLRQSGNTFREALIGAGLQDPFDIGAFFRMIDSIERIAIEQ